jgi:hypothetical protein
MEAMLGRKYWDMDGNTIGRNHPFQTEARGLQQVQRDTDPKIRLEETVGLLNPVKTFLSKDSRICPEFLFLHSFSAKCRVVMSPST